MHLFFPSTLITHLCWRLSIQNHVWPYEDAVSPDYQGRGFGKTIIRESIKLISSYLKRGSTLKLVKVTTGTTNEAQKLYKDTLHAQPVAVIPDFFRSDEVIMIARNADLADLILYSEILDSLIC